MTGFLIGAILLTVFVAAVLLAALLRSPRNGPSAPGDNRLAATLYRDQLAELERDRQANVLPEVEYEHARRELQRRLLEEAEGTVAAPTHNFSQGTLIAALAVLIIPVIAGVLYAVLGNPAALAPGATTAAQPHAVGMQQIEQMVSGLAARLANNPGDVEGWAMLARSYKVLGRYDEAVQAYAKAEPIVKGNPQLLCDYADSLALASNNSLAGRPAELIQQALAIDPDYPTALYMAGFAAMDQGQFETAIRHWERLRSQLPADSEDLKALDEHIARARQAADNAGSNSPR